MDKLIFSEQCRTASISTSTSGPSRWLTARPAQRSLPSPARRTAVSPAVLPLFLYAEGEAPVTVEAGERAVERRLAELAPRRGRPRGRLAVVPDRRRIAPAPRRRAAAGGIRARSLGAASRFLAWGAIALDETDPADVDRLLDDGFIGLSLPAGALSSPRELERLGPVLEPARSARRPALRPPRRGPSSFLSSRDRTGEPGRRARPSRARLVACAHPLRVRDAGRAGSRSSSRGGRTPACRSCSRCSPAAPRFTVSASPAAAGPACRTADPLFFYDCVFVRHACARRHGALRRASSRSSSAPTARSSSRACHLGEAARHAIAVTNPARALNGLAAAA